MKRNAYTTDCGTLTIEQLLNQKIEHQDPHQGLIIASHHFKKPFPIINEIDQLCLATMDLLIQFAYPSLSGHAKFTYKMSWTSLSSNFKKRDACNYGYHSFRCSYFRRTWTIHSIQPAYRDRER